MKNGTNQRVSSAARKAARAVDESTKSGKERTSISLPPEIMKEGKLRLRERRAASLSNYIEILIAEDIASAKRATIGEAVAA